MHNKLVIFDLDGVLIESRELHYDALNAALEKVGKEYIISREEHLSIYDGLNTTKKLEILTKNKGLPIKYYDQIWKDKQVATFDLIKRIPRNEEFVQMFKSIRDKGWKVAVASNSIRETVKLALMSVGVLEYTDYYVSNEDVKRTKPFPEMYWKCMTALHSLPRETIIVEDSHIGRKGAVDSGAHLLPVENSYDLKPYKVYEKMEEINNSHQNQTNIPWRDKKLNVVIPMAGAGSRFASAGFTFPKPLIDVRGKPMIQVVIENLNIEANYIFIVQKSHYEKYNLQYMLNLIAPGCKVVQIDGVTEGAACTVLAAKEYINTDEHLFMVNSDQFIDWNSNECMYSFSADDVDGGILTFKSTHPKYSYVKLDENGFVNEVVEKKVISDMATVGMYYWAKGSDFVKYAEQMIALDKRQNNEFYVAPVYQEAIDDGKKFKVKDINSFWSLGTPEDLSRYLQEYKK